MIPHIIHYCWFGRTTLPEAAQRCIESWRTYFPGYELKLWNEDNFDVSIFSFTKDAYQDKKYAFVSDFVRFWAIYHEGGLYLDVDVEVIASFDDIVKNGAFMGVETPSINASFPTVNPGLGFGAEKKNPVIGAILDYYKALSYFGDDRKRIPRTVVGHTTDVLMSSFYLRKTNEIQYLEGITIYPQDYFNPYDDAFGILQKTDNTRSIHWFAKSWIGMPNCYFKVTRFLHRLFGVRSFR